MVDLRDEGYGFLRVKGYLPTRDDVYVSVKQTRQFRLRRGDLVNGESRRPAATRRTRRCCRSTRSTASIPTGPRPAVASTTSPPLFPDERLHLLERATSRTT